MSALDGPVSARCLGHEAYTVCPGTQTRLKRWLPGDYAPKMERNYETRINGSERNSHARGRAAFAQTVGVGPTENVIIEPEQRTVIKEYVVKERVAPVTVKERISVGTTLPGDVELRTVPSTWGPKFSKYRYVYSGDRVYLVEPSNRTVVQVVE